MPTPKQLAFWLAPELKAEIEEGKQPKDDNVLKHAPHTAAAVASDTWKHGYSREKAAYPAKKAATAKLGKAAPDGPEFQAISSKLLKERKELLHKLAQ